MRKIFIEGQKLVTYLQKCRGNGGREVFQHVRLKKTGVISQKSEIVTKKAKKGQKKAKYLIKGQKLVTYLPKFRGNGGRRVSQQVHLNKMGVISQKIEK
jgi:hypothetical protein